MRSLPMSWNNRRRTTSLISALVIGNEVFGNTADYLGDPILPLHVPVGHLDLASRQTDHRRTPRGAGGGNGQVLDKGIELVGHSSMAIKEVQHLIERAEALAHLLP